MMIFFEKFLYAWEGLVAGYRLELSFRVQVWVGVFVVLTGIFFGLSGGEWALVFLAMGFVLSLELFN
jgi:diacylglycerol kinase